MGRQIGAFNYGERVEDDLHKIINKHPMTSNAAAEEMRKVNYRKIDRKTVKRMLVSLQNQKKIDNFIVGKVTIWSEKTIARNIKQNLSGK